MNDIVNWIESNIPWIFSGIGVFIVGLFIYKKNNKNSNKQTIKNNSSGIQAGRNVKINKK